MLAWPLALGSMLWAGWVAAKPPRGKANEGMQNTVALLACLFVWEHRLPPGGPGPVQVLACLLVRLPAIRGFKYDSIGYQLRPLSFRIVDGFAPRRENAYKTCVKSHILGPRWHPGDPREAPRRSPRGTSVTSACLLVRLPARCCCRCAGMALARLQRGGLEGAK